MLENHGRQRQAPLDHGSKSGADKDRPLSPAEIREVVANAKAKGLFTAAGATLKVSRTGLDAAALQAAGLDQVQVVFMLVTPALARGWLHNNLGNRRLKNDTVDAYARDARNGVWFTTHQGIAFNDADVLIDGQHRLHAIVKSGVPVILMVSFGWPSKRPGQKMTTMDAVDRGAPRSVGDQLLIQHGVKDGALKGQLCLQIANLCCPERQRKMSVADVLEILAVFGPSIDWAIEHRSRSHGLRSAGVLAAFAFAHAALPAEDHPHLAGMLAQLNTGEAIPPRSMIGLLREFLTSDAAKLLNRGADRALAELVLNTLHQHFEGRFTKTLEQSTAGADHFRARQTGRVAKIAALFQLPGSEKGK